MLQSLRLHLRYDGGNVAELAGALPSLSGLRCLELLSASMHGDDMRALATALGGLCHLETLQLWACYGSGQPLTGALAATLAQSLRGMRRLQELALMSMSLDPEAMAPLAAALQSLTFLQRLGLRCGRMGPAASLAPVLPALTVLTELHLADNGLGEGDKANVLNELRGAPLLRHVKL